MLSGNGANMINLSHVRNVVIDGSFSGTGKFLRFINTYKNANTLAFLNDCKSDTIMNCNFEGVDTATNKSVILIGTTNIVGSTGNDSIAILNNIIKDNTTGYPKNLIRSVGTVSAPNDNCIISGNEFINWSNEAVGLAAGTGDNWKILENSFYQSPTANIITSFYGIRTIANSGNGHIISGNSIGGTAPDRSGSTMKTTNSFSVSIAGIYISGSGSVSDPIKISKNNISNISIASNSSVNQTLIYGILMDAGTYASVDSNYIGNIPSNGGSNQSAVGIKTSESDVIISDNTIKRIYCSNGIMFCQTIGIFVSGSTNNNHYIINNNTVDSILGITRSSNYQIDNGTPSGICINTSSSTTGNQVSGNRVSNIFNTTNNTTPSATGILILNTNASTNIFNNQINTVGGFSNANGQGLGTRNLLYGIYHSGTGNDTLYNNLINIGVQSYPSAKVTGIYSTGNNGTRIYYNNTVTITGTSYLSNVGDVGESYAFAGSGNVILRNNIFNNKRTTPSIPFPPLPTRNYAISSASTALNSDYNLLFSVDTVVALAGTTPKTFSAWKTASNGDTNSVYAPITFVSATNLHIDATDANAWNVYGRGIAIPTINSDIDGDTRSTTIGVPVTIGADEIAMPSVPPANMVMTPSTPTSGTPALFTSAGKRIAEITWTGGVVPNTITGKYYPGVPAPNPATSPNSNSYFELTPDVTTGIAYTIKTYYTDAEAAGIPDANLQGIKSHTPGSWIGITLPNANNKDANGKYLQSVPLNDFSTFTMTGNSIPLSIDLKSITAKNAGNKNRIDWSTAKESEADYFELESSTDARNFRKVARINAKGQPSAYTYWDEKAVLGMNYYRLKMTTEDGAFIYSKTVSAEVKSLSGFTISAYPNPVQHKVALKIDGNIQPNAVIALIDISGKTLQTLNVTDHEMEIEIGNLAAGIYFIKYADDQQTQNIKITKQ